MRRNIAIGEAIATWANTPFYDVMSDSPIGSSDFRSINMIILFRSGGPMDYQRPNGWFAAFVFKDTHFEYRSVTNYNFGVVSAAAGYDLNEALSSAGLYNRTFGKARSTDTSWGIQQDAVNDIMQGWGDYYGRKW
ncbi:MAG: hypothetical protein NVSMB62_27690 [Acidobacteriaceae bacterium]